MLDLLNVERYWWLLCWLHLYLSRVLNWIYIGSLSVHVGLSPCLHRPTLLVAHIFFLTLFYCLPLFLNIHVHIHLEILPPVTHHYLSVQENLFLIHGCQILLLWDYFNHLQFLLLYLLHFLYLLRSDFYWLANVKMWCL